MIYDAVCDIVLLNLLLLLVPSVLWRCWLGGRKGIRPVKNEWWGSGMVICLEWGADLHMAQLMPLPLTVSCSSKIQIAFLVPAYPGFLEKRPLNGCKFIIRRIACTDRVHCCGLLLEMFCSLFVYACVCVCLLDTAVNHTKLAELIEMKLSLWTRWDQDNTYCIRWRPRSPQGKRQF